MDLGTSYVIQWSSYDRMIQVCPYSHMLEKNRDAYRDGRCVGFYPIAFARDRDHAEEVYNVIVHGSDVVHEGHPQTITDRWVN